MNSTNSARIVMHLTPRPLPVARRLLLLALAGALAYRTLFFLPAGVLTYVPR